MRITRTKFDKRYAQSVIAEQQECAFSTTAGFVSAERDVVKTQVSISLGRDKDDRSLALDLSLEEAERLHRRIGEAVQRVKDYQRQKGE